MRYLIFTILVIVTLFALLTIFSNNNSDTVLSQLHQGTVDLQKYSGQWFEITSLPNEFQKDCKSSAANYAVQSNATVGVTNTCQSIANGQLKTANALAWSNNAANTWLKVSFAFGNNPIAQMWPFSILSADYLILYVDDNYTQALVGSADKKYLWILSRNPTMAKQELNRLLLLAQTKGYRVASLMVQ